MHTKKSNFSKCRRTKIPVFALVLLLVFTAVSTAATVNASVVPAAEAEKSDIQVETGRRVPYCFSLDTINEWGASNMQSSLYILKNQSLETDRSIRISGWVMADEGILTYQYAWVPSFGTAECMITSGVQGSTLWQEPEDVNIFSRPDLMAQQIPHSSGYATAGFALSIFPPEDLPDGYYDVYLRAITPDGIACDLLVLLNTAYGSPDGITDSTRIINFDRLQKANACTDGASFSRQGDLVLKDSGAVCLGQLNLSAFDDMRIVYSTEKNFVAEDKNTDHRAILGLKTAPSADAGAAPAPFRMQDGRYNMTDVQGYVALEAGAEQRTAVIDLTECSGEAVLWLSGYLFENGQSQTAVTVHSITLSYSGQNCNRTAAKIYFSADLQKYFHSINKVDITTVSDEKMGDVMRIRAIEDTNDPYAYFEAGALLNEQDIRLNADDYKYIVLVARAAPQNTSPHMTFYLCAGGIGAPTEALTKSCDLQTDGQWHVYILDMHTPETWQGMIHGWRFDMINGQAYQGDYVDYASVQFFRTAKAAQAAADRALSDVEPYRGGVDAPVFADMSEESDSKPTYTVPADDIYIEVTEAPTAEPTTEAVTSPVETVIAPTTEAPTEASAEVPTRTPAGEMTDIPTESVTNAGDSGTTGDVTIATATPTTPATPITASAETDTSATTAPASQGCRSTLGLGTFLTLLALAAIGMRKK